MGKLRPARIGLMAVPVLALPAPPRTPVADRSTAAPPDVVLRAETDGYVTHVVVEDAAAAKQKALAEISLGLRSEEIATTLSRHDCHISGRRATLSPGVGSMPRRPGE